MSRTIDERVVSMQFDNRHFESNVKTTMSTLDKLKASLKLEGAHKSLDGLSTSVSKFNINPLSRGIETVTTKFSALQVVGVTALANITNSAVNAGKRIAAALTIEPVKMGFSEYETQINAVQTILANTSSKGTTLDQVNAALDELNTYADKTIYNFTEMTRNIGTFTAAGVDLQTSVNAIQGIANLAAVSGSTSQQASTAMYQLSQALAAGTIRLMDWNSVVNAGMGGEVFQNALKETSELLGTGAEKAIEATGSFRESLRQEWLTAEVLTETLKKFTTTGAAEYLEEYTGLSRDVIDAQMEMVEGAKDEAAAIEEASKALAEKSGRNKKEIKSAIEMAMTAQNAATKVKTFTQLLDTLKESIQSGWTQTWEILIGDFEEAKTLWTGISDFLTGDNGIITKMSNARNELLEESMTSGWSKFLKVLNKSGVSAGDLEDAVRSIVGDEKVTQLIKDYDSLEKVFQKGALSADILKQAMGALKKTTVDLSGVTRTLKRGSVGEDVKKVQEALVKLGYELPKYGVDGIIKAETTAAIKAFQEMEGLKVTGVVDQETLDALNEACNSTVELKGNIDEIIDSVTKLGGRDLLIDGFKNIATELGKIFDTIGKAWTNVFGEGITSDDVYSIVEKFHELTESMSFTEDQATRLQNILEGVFSALDISWSLASVSFMGGLKILNELLKLFGTDVGKILEYVALKITDLNHRIEDMAILGSNTKWKDIAEIIVAIYEGVKKCIVAFMGLEKVQAVIDRIREAFSNLFGDTEDIFDGLSIDGVKNTINEFFTKIESWIKGIDNAENVGRYLVEGIAKGLKNAVSSVVGTVVEIATAIYDAFCSFFGINSPSTLMIAAGGFIIAGLVIGLLSGKTKISDVISGIGETIKAGFTKLTDHLKKIDFGKVAAAMISAGMLYLVKRFIDVVEMFASPMGKLGAMFDAIGGAFKGLDKVFDSIAFENKTKGIKNIVAALAILLGAVAGLAFVISKYDISLADLGKVGLVIAVLAATIAALAWGMSKFADSAASFEKVGDKTTFSLRSIAPKLIALGAALLMMAGVVALLGNMDPNELKQGLITMAEVIAAMAGVLLAFRLLSIKDTGSLKSAGKVMRDMAVALLLMVAVIKLAAGLDRGEIERGVKFAAGFGIFVALLAKATSNMNSASFKTKGLKGKINDIGGMLIKVSIAMGLMVGVIKLVSYLKPDEMKRGAVFAAAFVVFIKSLVWATKIANGQQLAKIGGLVLSVSFSLLLMAGICKLVGSLSMEEIGKGILFVSAFGLLMAGFVKLLTIGNDKKMGQVAGSLTAFAIAIAAMSGAAILLGMIPTEYLIKGLAAVAALSAMMSLMVLATRGVGDIKANLIVMTIAIGLMAAAVAGLAAIAVDNPGALATATGALGSLMGMFALMTLSTSKIKNEKGMMSKLIAMTGIVLVLSGIVAILSQITDPDSAIQAVTGVSILLMAIMGSLAIIAQLDKRKLAIGKNLKSSLAAMVIVVAALGGVVAAMSWLINPEAIVQKMTALSMVLLAMSGALVVLSTIKIGSMDLVKKVGVLAAMTIPLAAFALALEKLPMGSIAGKQDAIIIIGATMAAMTGLLFALSAIGKFVTNPSDMATGIIGLTAMVIPLVAFGNAIEQLPMVSDKRATLETLATTMVAMTGLLAALTLIGGIAAAFGWVGIGGMALGIVGLTAMVIPMAVFGKAINNLPNITDKSATITILTGVMKTMTELLAVLSVLGRLAIGGILGMAELVIMCGLLVGLAWAIEWIPDISSSKETVTTLLDVMKTLTGLLDHLSKIGPKAILGTAALVILTNVMKSIGIFATSVGAIMTWIPSIEDFLNKGLPILENLAKSLGTMIGNFIAGFGESVTSALPGIAQNLTDFVTTLHDGVINNLKSVDETAVTGAKNVASILLALGGANLASAASQLISWLTGSTIDDMGTQLKDFAKAVVDFSNTLVEGNIDTGAIQAAADAGQMMAALSNAMPKTGGWWQDIIGTSDMKDFGDKMVAFGNALVEFSGTVAQDGVINTEAINKARDAGLAMNELADVIPKTGGLWQDIMGTADLKVFGESLAAYGTALVSFSESVAADDAISIDAINSARDAGLAMHELVDVIPKTGGVWQSIMGVEDLGVFGASIAAFGSALVSFSDTVAPGGTLKINPMAVAAAVLAGQLFAALNTALPESKGVFQKFCEFFTGGSMTMEQFGNELAGFGEAVGAFCESTDGINAEGLDLMASAIQKLVKCIKNMEGITTDGISDFKDAVNDLSDVDVTGFYESFTADKADNAASAVKKILNLIKSMVGLDSSGIATFKDALSQLATVEITKFVDAFSSAATELAQAGTDMMAGLVKGITNGAPQVLTITRTVLLRTYMMINSSAPQFMVSGALLATYLTRGLSTGYKNVIVVTRSALMSAAASIMAFYFSFYNSGSFIGGGLVSGVKSKQQAAYNAGYALGQAAARGVADGAQVESPSKLTIATGNWMGKGLVIGLNQMGGAVAKAGSGIGKLATDSISTAVAKVTDFINTDMDTSPVIRPVLDLTDVTNGANSLNRLFATNQTVGLMANVGYASASMAAVGQNGGNGDVVSAINKLSKKMDSLSGSTTNINGITYDDGSAVSQAVGTLTRAMRMERRI